MVVPDLDGVVAPEGDREREGSCPPLADQRQNKPAASVSPTVAMFREFRDRLDDKYDRLERLIKLSRDVTIESKRIIFQLHRISTDPSTLDKAAERLHVTRERFIHKIALELDGYDKYYYVRAFTPGLQEFIEAYGFYKYLKDGTLITYEELMNELLTFKVYCDTGYLCSSNKISRQFSADKGRNKRAGGGRGRYAAANYQSESTATGGTISHEILGSQTEEPAQPQSGDTGEQSSIHQSQSVDSGETKSITLFFPQVDFLLGLSDIPGELMRACIHAVANGNKQFVFSTCELIQRFYAGCLGIHISNKMREKIYTMRASVQKMEYSCYSLSIRDDKAKSTFLTDIFSDDGVHGEDYDSGTE